MSEPTNESTAPLRKPSRWAWAMLIIIAVPLVLLATHIDNWQRDFTTNVARTEPDATDLRLRPLGLELPIGESQQLVKRTIEQLPNWELATDWANNQISATRTTALFGFVDDIKITLSTSVNNDAATIVNAISQSRVGKGDLGQNPRNIDELFRALRSSIEEVNRSN